MVSWRRGKCIGKGSFGTVHLANSVSSDNVFAVKSVEINGSTNRLCSLENEIKFLRSLSSPYIVKYLNDDVSLEDSVTYRNLHMEYLPRGSVVDNGGSITDDRLLSSYTLCIVSALSYIHSMGIVHCDVKGRNVLVGSDPGHAKLADFGSAINPSSTNQILPRGSPLWMAPEVIRGEYQGPESDVWSLGCTLIEMITGKPAWHDNGADTIKRIGFSDDLPEFPSGLSDLGRDFIEKCLRRDFTWRWSCHQLLQHPFLSSASGFTIIESSPRCVLDWLSSGFESERESTLSSGFECEDYYKVSAFQRISKLVTKTGANWESDNWVSIRDYDTNDPQRETFEEIQDGTSSESAIESCSSRCELEVECESGGSCSGDDPSCLFGSMEMESEINEGQRTLMLSLVGFNFCDRMCISSNSVLKLLRFLMYFKRYIQCELVKLYVVLILTLISAFDSDDGHCQFCDSSLKWNIFMN